MFVGIDLHDARLDAVLVAGDQVRAVATCPATDEPSGGVARVLEALVAADPATATARAVTVSRSTPESLVIAPDRLAPTGCLRLCADDVEPTPPMTGWPDRLRGAIGDHVRVCRGGHEFDGTRLRSLDVPELRRIADGLVAAGVEVVAVTAVYSPVNHAGEQAAATTLTEAQPSLRVCLSHEIASLGLFERENATIVNAALLPLAERVAQATAADVAKVIPGAGVYRAQNDGTAMELSFARRYPVLALWSGCACAISGAALLGGYDDCVVVDVRDGVAVVGTCQDGSPRQVRHDVDVAGIPMSLRRAETVEVAADPDGGFDPAALERAVQAVDPWRRSPVVLVGTHAASVSPRFVAERPAYGQVAGAVGAARLRIGGEVDRILSGDAATRAAGVREATGLAMRRAVMAGAVDRTVRVVEVEEIPLAYLPGDFVRLRVLAIGGLG